MNYPTPLRFLFVWTLGMAFSLAQDGDGGRRTIDEKMYHLGVAGMPEWEEFARSAPHGPQLDIRFSAKANAREHTLFIRQRNVKAAWNVMLNGRKLGALETLSQPLVLALAVPAGALKDGENRLSIVRVPSRMLDDIVAGEIVLEDRPREETLGRATLEITVVESLGAAPLPCRLTLVDKHQALAPLRALPGQSLAVRTGVVYTGDGRARLGTAPGRYILYASRGFAYGVATQELELADGETRRVELSLTREVPTPGFIACDSHIHTLTYSRHGDATVDERMLTIAGEGIELAIATDHNHHADYTEPAARLGMDAHFTSVVGNEVTTRVGHFNAFPVPADGPVPDAKSTNWAELLHTIRSVTGAKVVTLNHPRDLHENFTPFDAAKFDPVSGEIKIARKFDCDAIEVVTSAAMQSDILQLYRDWFALLNHGYRVAAIGASDTHNVSEFILGQARTYVASRATDPAHIDLDEVWNSYREKRLLVSMGLLTTMRVDERFDVGDLAIGSSRELRVDIEVLGPSWVNADRVELYANGVKIREQKIAATPQPRKARVTWTLPRPMHDVHLVAIATGPGVTAPYWETPAPYQPSSKKFTPRVVGSTNPIWIDGDGDGRFTCAREYALHVVEAVGRQPEKVKAALAGYDEAVAVQAADLMRNGSR